MADLLQNFAYCALTGAVNSSVTSFPVDECSRLPTSAQLAANDFYMTVESSYVLGLFEVVKVTAKSATSGPGNLTVVRGADSSTAASHPSGAYLKAAVTAGVMQRALSNVLKGAWSTAASYKAGDVVTNNGNTYVASAAHGVTPSPTFVGASHGEGDSSGPDQVAWPTGIAQGDLALLTLATFTGRTPASIAGWSKVGTWLGQAVGFQEEFTLWTRTLDGTETAGTNVTLENPAQSGYATHLRVYRNVTLSGVLQNASTTTTTQTVTAGDIVVNYFGLERNSAATTVTFTAPTGQSNPVSNYASSFASQWSGDETFVSAGTTSARTIASDVPGGNASYIAVAVRLVSSSTGFSITGWSVLAQKGGGAGLKTSATSGVQITSTSPQVLDSANLTATVANVSVGDWLEVSVALTWGSETVDSFIDVVTRVSSATVHYLSNTTATQTRGMQGMYSPGGRSEGASDRILYQVQATDLSGTNQVTLAVVGWTGTAVTKSIVTDANSKIRLMVTNHGSTGIVS